MKEGRQRPGAYHPEDHGRPKPPRGNTFGSRPTDSETTFFNRLPRSRKIIPLPIEFSALPQQPTETEPTDGIVPPTEKDQQLANSGTRTIGTEPVELVGGQKGHISALLASGFGISAVVVVGGTVYALRETVFAHEQRPAVHQPVDPAFVDNLGVRDGDGTTVPIPDTNTNKPNPEERFDPTATEGVIKPSMTEALPQAQIDAMYPTAFGKLKENGNNAVITIRQPYSEEERAKGEQEGVIIPDLQFEIREDKGTLQMQYPLDLSQSSDPSAEISFKRGYGGFTATDRMALKDKGYYDWWGFQDVPKGTIIEAPVDGFLVISRTNGAKYDPEHATTGFINFQAPNGNIYRLSITGAAGRNTFVFVPLLDAPELNPEQNHMPVGTYGIPVTRGQPLFRTNTKLDEVGFKILVAIKGKIGEPPEMIKKPFIPTTIEFIVSQTKRLLRRGRKAN